MDMHSGIVDVNVDEKLLLEELVLGREIQSLVVFVAPQKGKKD